ncbi:MAG: TlpA disulfide reductase family protein [Pseudomonadota bacterium]
MNRLIGTFALTAMLLTGCGDDGATSAPREAEGEAPAGTTIAGSWRAVLSSPGGELPFELVIGDDQASGYVLNGEEQVPFGTVVRNGSELVMSYPWYDSEITAELSDDGSVMRGRWRKTHEGGKDSALPFSATRGMAIRFLPLASSGSDDPPASIDGAWRVEFSDEDGTEPARGEFVQVGQAVTGTFLTPTGDYRFLAGSFEENRLRLSAFDGAHVFLFDARLDEEGTLSGDFWSRETYHATWEASRADEGEEILPDAWEQVSLNSDSNQIDFEFQNLVGETVSLKDPRFEGKVVLVNLFGSWCPNCNDEAPLLSRWYRERRDEGLEIVGLAFEFTGDVERDRVMIGRFRDRHEIEYELLLAGVNDKEEAAATLCFLDKVVAYPTTLFLDRDHQVQRIHSGFAGPGTGEFHTEMLKELQAELDRLLAEPTI